MAMCARKDLLEDLKKRREAFRRETGESFFEKLKSRIDRRMIIVHDQQEKLKQWKSRARRANHNIEITI